MAADYEVNLSQTDSESFRFEVLLEGADLTGKTFEYVLDGCDGFKLTEANGLVVDAGTSTVAIRPDPERRLRPGSYPHGLRSTDADNVTVQHFDGEVSVSKGGF